MYRDGINGEGKGIFSSKHKPANDAINNRIIGITD
jgi:hypothetical protein